MTYRILTLIKSLGLGGAERLLLDQVPEVDRARFAHHIAYMLPWKGYLVPHLQAAGWPVYCLGRSDLQAVDNDSSVTEVTGARALSAASLLPVALGRLMALQRRVRFNLIHADLPQAGLLARLAGKRYGVPVVYTEHNLQERYHPLTRVANRLTYAWNARVIAVSDEVAASIRRKGMDRHTQVIALPNGVPVEQIQAEAALNMDELRVELDIPVGRPVVGTVAVFRPQKRLLDWLEVAAHIAKSDNDTLFLLVGDGPEMPAVRERIQALGLQERVRLPGFRADGRRLMGLMDIYLMTSQFEGLPIALLEAMALGKPVVSTPVGGIPQAVTHGVEGYLGQVDALAGHLLQLLANPQQAKAMGQQAARRIVRDYHIRHRVRVIEAIYTELLETQTG